MYTVVRYGKDMLIAAHSHEFLGVIVLVDIPFDIVTEAHDKASAMS